MIPIVRPELGEAEQRAAAQAVASGWVSHGARCVEFESMVAARVGVRHARSVNSCTNAILLTLLALGLEPGDEVLVPAFTCVAALNPIELLGGVPVPVDVELSSFAMTVSELELAITLKTRGVIFAHLFGLCGDIEPVAALCRDRGIWLIEDIALGLGSSISGRALGSFGDAAALSFHPRKLITTGEGGMLATNRRELADAVAALRNYGASRPAWERHNQRLFDLPTYAVAGLNCKLTDIQAAIGIEQVKRMDELIEARTAIATRYDDAFRMLDWAAPARPRPSTTSSWQSYVLLFKNVSSGDQTRFSARDRLLEHMNDRGIAAVQGAQAMHTIAYYRQHYGWASERFPNAAAADRGTVCLPIFPSLSVDEQTRVIEAVCSFHP